MTRKTSSDEKPTDEVAPKPPRKRAKRESAKTPYECSARDPLAELTEVRELPYRYAFDAEQLVRDVDAGPTPESAAQVFASQVHANMAEPAAGRIATFDPTWITAIAQAVLTIVQACPKAKVQGALTTSKERPRSLRAQFIRFQLARKLPGHWLGDALEAARAMIETGIQNLETDLLDVFYPEPAPAPAPQPDPAPGPAPAPSPVPVPEPVPTPAATVLLPDPPDPSCGA